MIDPFNIETPQTVFQEQELITFLICAANTSAVAVAPKVDRLLFARSLLRNSLPYPFVVLRDLQAKPGGLEFALKAARIGCWKMKARHLDGILQVSMTGEYNSLKLLEPLIGPKTSRMYLLFRDPTRTDLAVLDRHQLAWLRGKGYPGVPAETPARGWAYNRWELLYLEECRKEGLTPFEVDQREWRARARRPSEQE